ncbi:hypothetical protein ACFL43_02530 [Thermodesulfobacteriota bacterium]
MARQYTLMKYRYDALTVEWLRSRGYITEVLSSPCYCDVVGYHPKLKRFVIVEVKSPRETDASAVWQTEYNVKGMSRKKLLEQIKTATGYEKAPGLWRLYSFTLSSQLFTYYKSAEEHLDVARKRNRKLQRIDIRKVRMVPYLAVPVENEGVVREVVGFFKERGWIKGCRFYRAGGLAVVAAGY